MDYQDQDTYYQVQVGRSKYAVNFIHSFKGKTHVGYIDYKQKTITVAYHGGVSGRALSSAELKECVLHELVHGILHDMKHPLQQNEKFVAAFAKRWARVKFSPRQKTGKSHANSLVAQRAERLRKLRAKVPRGSRAKKAQAGKHRANTLR